MKFAIYNSRSISSPFQDTDMEILRTSLAFNAAHDITGFLHRSAQHYYQYIEGPSHHIDALLARIAKDLRHTEFQLLQTGETDHRRFGNWSMGYSQAASEVQSNFSAQHSKGKTASHFLHREVQKPQTARPLKEPI